VDEGERMISLERNWIQQQTMLVDGKMFWIRSIGRKLNLLDNTGAKSSTRFPWSGKIAIPPTPKYHGAVLTTPMLFVWRKFPICTAMILKGSGSEDHLVAQSECWVDSSSMSTKLR